MADPSVKKRGFIVGGNFGRFVTIGTKTVKKASRVLIEKYYPRLTLDFQTNKKICDEVAIIASKRLRNKIAGFTTHLMKRISRGPVRGISFKLQEEERERKDNYVPEFSALDTSVIELIPIPRNSSSLLTSRTLLVSRFPLPSLPTPRLTSVVLAVTTAPVRLVLPVLKVKLFKLKFFYCNIADRLLQLVLYRCNKRMWCY
ncbi:unnamed protein product [Umbelopsis ramanniana]